jgi:Tfp pilus assembly protein FimT
MMALLLVILVPLAALVVYAIAFDLRRRQRRSVPRSHDISSAARMARAEADARGASGLESRDPGRGSGTVY